MDENYISFTDVNFSYDHKSIPVVKSCSFQLNEGDRMVLRGESGTGKSTIFRLLLGFEIPDTGDILYRGSQLDDEIVQKVRSQTAWLPQDLDLGSDTVKSLVQLPLQFEKNRAEQPAKDQIIETFERLGLPASSFEKEFSDLSTGERQRVGIAICHLLDKPLILLDEPTSALDLASKKKVANLLFGNSKRTILSTSHDPWWIKQNNNVFELNSN